jgi:hypothetical protein
MDPSEEEEQSTTADDPDDEGMGTSPEIRRSESLAEPGTGAVEKAGGASTEVASGGSGDAGSGFDVYGEYIKAELEVQDNRKASFEQRALAVITTSGTLVTLLFALAAFSTKEADTFTLPSAAKWFLALGLVLFFASAFGALRTNAPVEYQAVIADDIRKRLRDDTYSESASAATRDVAFTRLKELKSAKELNGEKGRWLQRAMVCEALGVGCVGIAILIIIL